MSGLNLGFGGGIKFGGAGTTVANAPPATLSQVAYGPGTSVMQPSGIQGWHFGVGVAAGSLLLLAFVRWTLPG